MTVGLISYECPVCRKSYTWWQVDRYRRLNPRFFCPGCWQMIDVDDLIEYDDNPETVHIGCAGNNDPEITVASYARTSEGIGPSGTVIP